jgi:dolichyl-phosphate beta-glucosyltransferase
MTHHLIELEPVSMPTPPYISLILPAYNEGRVLPRTIAEAKSYFEDRKFTYEIIVAADGTDGSRDALAEMAQGDPTLTVIGSVERRGKGCGVREAVACSRGEIIGFSDADNKTPITEFDKFEPLLHEHQLVIGSRALRDSKIERRQPFYRRIGSAGFGVFMRTITGLHDIIDTQCGFKFFQRDAALDLFARQQIDGYMFDVEILYLAKQSGYSIAEVPVRWRDDADSRLQLVSGNIRNVLDIFRIRLRSSRKVYSNVRTDKATLT